MNKSFAIAAAALLAPTAAMAAESAPVAYSHYHMAIEAAASCRNLDFDLGAHEKFAAAISDLIGQSPGSRLLFLIENGQAEADRLIAEKGCDSAPLHEALTLFDTDLASALSRPRPWS